MGTPLGARAATSSHSNPGGGEIRTLLVGTGPGAARCARRLRRFDRTRTLVGALDSRVMPHLELEAPGVPWLGSVADLPTIVRQQCVDEILVALPMRSGFDQLVEVRSLGRELGIAVSLELDLSRDAGEAEEVPEGRAVRIALGRHPASRFPGRQVKRAIDLALGTLALLVASPVFVLAALAVEIGSRGPVFFRQARIGRGGREFVMIKFRTMREDAEQLRPDLEQLNDATGASFKIFRDPRVTPAGRLLRRTSIDELPQLFNVLRGEMSLVGPRPVPKWVAERLPNATHHRRLSVLPGITGLWQVRDRRQDFEHMARIDLEYVDGWSVGLDLRILAATIPAILGGRNAY